MNICRSGLLASPSTNKPPIELSASLHLSIKRDAGIDSEQMKPLGNYDYK
jgi:hypothetical protein